MQKLHFILNPVAGGGFCQDRFARVERLLKERGVRYTLAYTGYSGHGAVLAQQAVRAGYQYVVAVGGDGTAREVASRLIHTGVTMGILPFGSGNDLRRPLCIPTQPEAAAELLLSGKAHNIDVGTANGQIFLNVAGLGFDVDVLEKTEHYKRFIRGFPAYFLGLLHALFGLRGYGADIAAPDRTLKKNITILSVGNGSHIGGGMNVTPGADVRDGLLDVCAVDIVRRGRLLSLLGKFIKGAHTALDITDYFRTDKVVVDCIPGAKVQLDGEILEKTPVTFEVLPGALKIITGLPER